MAPPASLVHPSSLRPILSRPLPSIPSPPSLPDLISLALSLRTQRPARSSPSSLISLAASLPPQRRGLALPPPASSAPAPPRPSPRSASSLPCARAPPLPASACRSRAPRSRPRRRPLLFRRRSGPLRCPASPEPCAKTSPASVSVLPAPSPSAAPCFVPSVVVPIDPSAPHTWPQPRAVVTMPTRTGAILDRQVPFGFIKTFMQNYTR